MDDDDEAAALAYQEECEQEQKEMEQIDQIAAFNTAYADAQMECENPPLDSVNPAYRSKFSSLAATRNSVIPVFAKYGIAIQQYPKTVAVDGKLFAGVETVLRHRAGYAVSLGDCLMPVQKQDAQGIASCVTYAKRQTLQAIGGVTGEVDDDAEQAVKTDAKPAMVHSAKDDLPAVDPARVKVVADEITRAWNADVDEDAKALTVFDVHEAVRGDQAVYAAAMDEAAKSLKNLKSGWREMVKKGREIAEQPAFRRAG